MSVFGAISLLFALLGSAVAARACSDFQRAPHPRWKTENSQGVQWLLTPCGERFFSIGVNVVDGGAESREINGRIHYHWPSFSRDIKTWAERTRLRLRQWGFNTLGAWSLSPAVLTMPAVIDLSLGKNTAFHWTDPFDPKNLTRLRAAARTAVAAFKGNPYRIGYFTDNEVGWWNGSLFTVFSAFPPDNHTKQRLVALLTHHYKSNWQAFLRDFVTPSDVHSFSALLRSRNETRLRPGGKGIGVVRQWTALVAEHYYRSVAMVLREADPEALILGDRLPIYYDADAVRVMSSYVDVISVNYNLDAPNGWVAPYFFRAMQQLSGGKPVLISEWFFAAHENRSGNLNRTGPPNETGDFNRSSNINLTGHLMTVKTQEDRARGAAAGVRRLASIPSVLGVHWFQYYDHPKGGRDDGEDYNFGLVDINDQPYEKLTEAFSRVHPTLADAHKNASWTQGSRRLTTIPRAEVDLTDSSLADWPLDTAVMPLETKPSEAVFGDLYMSWSSRGVNLATITMDYYDSELLAYDGQFPRSEAFRIDLGLDAGKGARRFALLVIPDRAAQGEVRPRFRIEFCREQDMPCVPVPGAQAKYFGVAMDQPRVILEAMLPWTALGIEQPPVEGMRMAAAVTGYYRARWMSSTGAEPARLFADSKSWPILQLQHADSR